jgi:hypothetical protein
MRILARNLSNIILHPDRILPALRHPRPKVKQALDFLAPKFGVPDARLPEVGREYSPFAYGKYSQRAGKPRITISPCAAFHGSCIETITCGEEVGHYLHECANPSFCDAWPKTEAWTQDDHRTARFIRNWEECIGHYAGALYAAHCKAATTPGGKWFKDRPKKGEPYWKRHFPLVTDHLVGYRAADELITRDPNGACLAEIARLGHDDARQYAQGLRSWPRYWAVLERQSHAPGSGDGHAREAL